VNYRFAYFTAGGAATTAATASAADKTAGVTLDSLRRDVTETRDSLRRLDSHMEELAHDVNVLSTDVRTLLRALHSVLHADDDRSRPPTTSNKPHMSRHSPSKTHSKPSEPSSRPPTSSVTQKKRGSLVDTSPENVDVRIRQPLHDDPTRILGQPPAIVPRTSRVGSASSSRDSDEVDTEVAAGEQACVFTDGGGPPVSSRRVAGDWHPGVVGMTPETGGTARSRSRTPATTQWDNGETSTAPTPSTGLTSSNSHASVLLTTDL